MSQDQRKIYLNIQEQVEKNKKDILDIQQGATVLADFGIKVIGYVTDASELPDPAEYEGDYGDAYAVGTEQPYDFYIFTRAFEGQEEPSWFNIGEFPVPGPQGETGPAGQDGSNGRGIVSIAKTSTSGLEDTYTITYTDGTTSSYVVKNGADGESANIVGASATVDSGTGTPAVSVTLGGTPQARSFAFEFSNMRGAQGEQGEPGSFIFAGQVATASLLPDASNVEPKYLYLVGASEPYDVYAIIESGDTRSWINLGPVAVTISDTKVGANSWSSSGTLAAEVLNELVNTQTADFVRIGTFFFAKKSTGRYFCADRISGEVHVYTLDIDLTTGEWTIVDETMIDADSAQTIGGEKLFSDLIKFASNLANEQGVAALRFFGSYIRSYLNFVANADASKDIGSQSIRWRDFYLSGKIKDGTNEFNADNVFNRITAPASTILTDSEYAIITNGRDTMIEGTFLSMKNPRIIALAEYSSSWSGYFIGRDASQGWSKLSIITINKSTKAVNETSQPISINSITSSVINGKTFPAYPTTNTSPQVLTIGANGGSLAWEDKPTTLYKHTMVLQVQNSETQRNFVLITTNPNSFANLTGSELVSELDLCNHTSFFNIDNGSSVLRWKAKYQDDTALEIYWLENISPVFGAAYISSVVSDTVTKL